jgi:transposase
VTLITCRYNGVNKILAVVDGKEKATIKAFLAAIPKKKQKTITAVCIDLCENYINAAKEELGDNIPIIADRFHVAQLYRQAIKDLRCRELKRLKKELSADDYKKLRPAIKILIKKHECYSKQDKEILSALFILSPSIKAAYRLARELTHIYNKHHRKTYHHNQVQTIGQFNGRDIWHRQAQHTQINKDQHAQADHHCQYMCRFNPVVQVVRLFNSPTA